MNTPKLTSILAGTQTHLDTGRTGVPANATKGLDFSQLLGERRSQAATPPAQATARRNDAAPEPSTQQRPTDDTAANRDPAPAGDTTAEARNSRSNTAQESPATAAASNDSPQPTEPNVAASEEQTSVATTEIATDTAAQAPAQTDAELAVNAAETGLPILAPVQMTEVAQVAATQAGSVAARPQTVPGTPAPVADVAHAPTPGAGAPATALFDSVTADAEPDAPASTRVAVNPQAFSAAPAVSPAMQPVNPAVAAAPEAVSTSPRTPDALPLPVAIDADTAAARSLQEFTAMVEAARATSGTSLQPSQPAAHHVAVSPAAMMPGMVPVGLMPAQGAPVATGAVMAPLSSPQWSTELGRQFISLTQMGNNLGQVAELRLDPPELGPLRITINLNDNVAHAVFSSPHAAVRQTVENALPQLQQMLEQAGISLGQANVNDQPSSGGFHDESRNGSRHAGTPTGNDGGSPTGAEGIASAPAGRSADPDALVDTFA